MTVPLPLPAILGLRPLLRAWLGCPGDVMEFCSSAPVLPQVVRHRLTPPFTLNSGLLHAAAVTWARPSGCSPLTWQLL